MASLEALRKIESEGRLSLPEAEAEVAVGRRTLLRWIKVGVRGRRLEAVRRGDKYLTSLAALERFLAGLPGQQDLEPPAAAEPEERG